MRCISVGRVSVGRVYLQDVSVLGERMSVVRCSLRYIDVFIYASVPLFTSNHHPRSFPSRRLCTTRD